MEKKQQSVSKKVWDILSSVLVICLAILAVLLMGARIIGLRVYTIVSGSMRPTYEIGDLIYVQKVSAEDVRVGDAITFVLNEELVVATHRVIGVDPENQRFYTQGDNNQVADASPVYYQNLIGKPVFRIPYLGYVSDWIQTSPGIYIAIGGGIALLAAVFLPDLVRRKKNGTDEQTEKAD